MPFLFQPPLKVLRVGFIFQISCYSIIRQDAKKPSVMLGLRESFYINVVANTLIHTLSQHCIGNFNKTRDVCTIHIVDVTIFLLTITHAIAMDVFHDAM